MTDAGRKSAGDQVKETATPQSQKGLLDKASESASSALDKGVGAVQPGDSKSTTQKVSDTTRGNADSAKNDGKGIVQSVTDTAAGLVDSASKAATDAANYISESTNTKK